MWWPFQWLVIYVLGGLTFVPLVVILLIGYVVKYGSVPIGDDDPDKKIKARLQAQNERDELLEREKNRAATGKPLSGWLTVRRQFAPTNNTSSIFLPNTTTTTTSSTAPESSNGIDTPLLPDEALLDKDDASIRSGTSTPNANSSSNSSAQPPSSVSTAASIVAPTTYSARIAQTYRQVMESRQKKDPTPKEYLFAVLKGTVLFLYEDEQQEECVAAIGVNKYLVGMEGKEGGRWKGKDAEMFAKRNALVLRVVEKEGGKAGLPVLAKGMAAGGEVSQKEEEKEMESAPWFLFSKSNTKTEDWFLALTQVSALQPTTEGVFSEGDMQALVDTIDTEPDPIPMRWLNAMIGRVFFGLYRTEALEQFIINKIMKKLSKVPRPNFLGPIVIREVNVGTFPPIFSKPMLKDLTAEGTASFEVHLNYRSRPNQPNSEVRITIATTATIPTGFKPYVVDLVLAVVLKSFEGNMVMQIKKPPSNRFWYGFTHMPKMEVEIQPIVSERKIQIGMILKAIEKQLREVIAESVVLPNMDDVAFFDTSELDIRGGIFSTAGKKVDGPVVDVPAGRGDPPTQPGVEIGTSAEDPASATAETAGMRRRAPTKSQTMGHTGPGSTSVNREEEKEPPAIIPRVDTAPAGFLVGREGSVMATSTVQATKKWFGNTARPPSISSIAALAPKNPSKESLDTHRSHSVERNQERPAKTLPKQLAEASSLVPDLEHKVPGEKVGLGITTNNLPSAPAPAQASPQRPTRTSFESTSTAAAPADRAISASPTGSNNAASLITSLRARDKQAIQSQVNTARDAVKKWGVNWAAKRRTQMGGTIDEQPTDRPAAIYRPSDEDEVHATDPPLSRSAEGPKSLQDRLNAAAAIGNRPKSGSISSTSPPQPSISSGSRPILQPSPSKTSISQFGSSPPQWTLSTGGPTTEIAKADVAAKTGGIPVSAQTRLGKVNDQHTQATKERHERRGSSSTPVLTQPMAGKSMVVPRVPRRPGQVVGIGSSEAGITRRISGSEDEVDRAGMVVPPVLPLDRSTSEIEAREQEGGVLPPKPSASQGPSKPSASVNDETAVVVDGSGSNSAVDDSGSTPSPPEGEPLSRSDSAPASTDVPPLVPISKEASSMDAEGAKTDSSGEDAKVVQSTAKEDDMEVDDHLVEGNISEPGLQETRGAASTLGKGEEDARKVSTES